MELRASDADIFVRSTHLLASLDRKRFSEEQLEIIDAALAACERVQAERERRNKYQTKYIAEKRKADPSYAQSEERKSTYKGKRGRPRKNPEETK